MKKDETGRREPDQRLWNKIKNRIKSGEGERPPAEELARFLEQGGDEKIREKVFDWLANENGAIDELRLLQEPVSPVSEFDERLLELAKSRVRNLAFVPSMEPQKESLWSRCVNFFFDLISFRGWAATVVAGCVLLGFSLMAFHLGKATFIDRVQTREILTRELTFGLSEVFAIRENSPCFAIPNKGGQE